MPELYLPFFESLPPEGRQPLPYMALTPTFRGIGQLSEPERLLYLIRDAMYVVEWRDGRLATARFPIHGVCRIERAAILLHSWITIFASAGSRATHSITLRFNTVTDHVMAPFIDALRAAPTETSTASLNFERERFDYLAQSHYKFFSHGRNFVRPLDRVVEVLLQPEVRGDLFRVLGYAISRRISAAHLTILTESELIMIRDEDSQHWIQGSAPGAIWDTSRAG